MPDSFEDQYARKATLLERALKEADKMDREQGLVENTDYKEKVKKNVVRQRVVECLKDMEPLTPLTLADLYKQLETGGNTKSTAAVRAALYGVSVGCKVSESNTPSLYYSIKLHLNGEDVFLSLPGVPSKDIKNDKLSLQKRKDIINSFRKNYGEEVINYWVQSAQYRSVSIAAPGMREAKKRDNKTCKICKYLRRESDQPVSAHHIVSRKALFWETLEIVEKLKGGIFSDGAVIELKKLLTENELHSSSQFIVTLCKEHDDLVQEALGESIERTTTKKLKTKKNNSDHPDLPEVTYKSI